MFAFSLHMQQFLLPFRSFPVFGDIYGRLVYKGLQFYSSCDAGICKLVYCNIIIVLLA